MHSVPIIPPRPSIASCSADECPIGSRWHADWRAFDRLKTPEWFYRFDGLDGRWSARRRSTGALGRATASSSQESALPLSRMRPTGTPRSR